MTPTRRWRAVGVRLLAGVIQVALIFMVSGDASNGNSLYTQLLLRADGATFDYIGWEIDALRGKAGQQVAGVADYLTEAQRAAYVHEYLKQVGNTQSLDAQIAAVYANPVVKDPAAASVELRTRRDAARAEVARREPLAEAIAEGQVASVLRDEGFATLGQIIPPVSAHITQLPEFLVVSPRDTIRLESAINVIDLSADQATALEDQIDHELNVSSLIVPLGGLSLYPSMVIQTWHAPTLFEVIAHEWSHHYLYFFPLGLSYDAPETRIINETTATLFGKEIGRKVIEKFYRNYPDILAELPQISATPGATARPTPTPQPDPGERPRFDYATALNETRITVDFYLHFGLIDLAESYMNAQRVVFAAHGYVFRKINQAFFAFYGGYQGVGGSGVGGTDPIGPAITTLRSRQPTIRTWLEQMRTITTRAELIAAAR